MPFYWWAGEKLDRGRLAWQLDQLCAQGVKQTIISYPHRADGSTDPGDPALFSPAWWDLFRWFLDQCRARGMTVGVQDYTITRSVLDEIGRATPDMEGGQLGCVSDLVQDGATARLPAGHGTRTVAAWAYPVRNGVAQPDEAIDLSGHVREGVLTWRAGAGRWLVALVFVRPGIFDPLHPDAGRLAIGRLYEPFVRECPGEVGRTLTLFFQDELDFGSCMPFWSNRLFEVFRNDKGYDLRPWLPALWLDLGPRTEKVRLDYADAVVRRMEACYFEPVFRWHEAHGTLFGHDNCGRGDIASGRRHYGDYVRTMRWFSAPGTDDPEIQGPRAFRGLKVNSSIAHLYRRPRVWNEAFHSSGWGTAPAQVLAALREDFAYGATVVNLHGLFYSTHGGWWEWASPDFHFRQPYWEHSRALNDWSARMSWALSQGTHRCDVAILYPIASLDAEPEAMDGSGVDIHLGNDVVTGDEPAVPTPENVAFGLGKYLFDRACDFDFIDDESMARAEVDGDALRVGGEDYRVLILPAMRAVRWATLEKALAFVRAGGVVIAYGCLPSASDRAGRDDPELDALRVKVCGASAEGKGLFIERGYGEVLRAIDAHVVREVIASPAPMHVLHRRLERADLFLVFNPSASPVEARLRVCASGAAEVWDALTGEAAPLPGVKSENGFRTLSLNLAAQESRLLVFDADKAPPAAPDIDPQDGPKELIRLDGSWEFSLCPTLDNRFGDFRLPPSAGTLGPEARTFRYAEETSADAAWSGGGFDDSSWPVTTFSFGQRLVTLGPLPAADAGKLEARLVAGEAAGGPWRPYAFSLRWGIERDPFLADRLSGPHGLKNRVPDEFLDFHDSVPGTVWYLRSEVLAEKDGEVVLRMGARCAYRAWVNGKAVLDQTEALPPGLQSLWNLPHYESTAREAPVMLRKGVNRLLVKLVQPVGQRTRAYVAFAPPVRGELRLPWFSDPAEPRPSWPAAPDRRAIWFRFSTPPGFKGMTFRARGPVRAWADGRELTIQSLGAEGDGCCEYRAFGADPVPHPVTAALRVEAPLESRAGDALPEPVRFECGAGRLPAGDWCAHGLAVYSGIGVYRRPFHLAGMPAGQRVILDLGDVAATAEVRVNGHSAATLIAPPWRVDLTRWVSPGDHVLEIRVANTLANHYSVGIPTPYAFPSQTRSGLMGPVRLLTLDTAAEDIDTRMKQDEEEVCMKGAAHDG